MRANSLAAKALKVLQAGPAEGMKPAQIAEATGIGKNNINRVLNELTTGKLAQRMERESFEVGYRYRAIDGATAAVSGDGAAEPPKREWKGRATKSSKKKSRKKVAPKAHTPPGEVERETARFRVGIFNDGGLAILARRGGLELDEDEASELAGFCAQHFGDGE